MDQEKDKKTPSVGPWDGETSTQHLENSSPAELADALEAMLDSVSEETYDPDLVTAYLDALEKKAPMAEPPDARAAQADFRRKLGAVKPAQETQPVKRRRYRVPVTVAATLALLFTLMVCVQAAGFDIFGSLARWTEETFHFTPSAQETAVSPYYEPLRQALEDNRIPGDLAPQWYPEGFAALAPEVEKNRFSTTVSTTFQDSSGKEFTVSITWKPDSEGPEPRAYEKDDTSVEVYASGERTFYILANSENTTWAVWSEGSFEESIRGALSVDEVKKIIDLIGG